MEFRKAFKSDANSIMNIIKQAKNYFKEQEIDQWQDNYPNYDTVYNDIVNNYGYVLLKDNIIIGTAAVSFDGEKTYEHIYNGEWISDDEYVVIHRIAINSKYKGKGLASLIIKNVEKICLEKNVHSIKIDTHRENLAMQKLLKKNGFTYCGIIYLGDGSERIAFEKSL